MYRLTCQSINHLDSEGRKTASVICLGSEETGGRLYESIETFFGREVSLVARHRRPEQRRAVDSVVPWHTPHCRQLTADIVLDAPQFLGIVAPRHYVAVASHGGKAVAVCLVQIAVYPLLVNGIAPAIP